MLRWFRTNREPAHSLAPFAPQSLRLRQRWLLRNSEIEIINYRIRSYYKTSNYSKLKAEYHHSYEFRRGGDSIDLQPHKANVAEQTEHHNDAASLDFSLFSADGRHSGNIYSSLQHINRNSYYGGNQDLNAYGTTKDLTSVTGLQYRLSWMRNSKLPADFVVGAEYLYNGLNDVIQGYNHHIDQHTHLYGGFVQNEWKNKSSVFWWVPV